MDFESEPEVIPASESLTEGKLRNKREYKFDPWGKVKNLSVDLNIEELVQLSPYAQQAIKVGISNTKPTTQQVNVVEDRLTPAYATATVQGRPTSVIVDSGATLCIISQIFLVRLGWEIDQASNRKIIVADGTKTTALGEMKDIPVQFGNCMIPINMTVCESTSYDIILGVDWLAKAQAKIDFGAAKMRITYHGQDEEIPLDLTRGAHPTMVDTDSEKEDQDQNESSDEEALINTAAKNWSGETEDSDGDYPTEAQQKKEEERTLTFEEWYENKVQLKNKEEAL